MQNMLIRQGLEIGNSCRITPTASKKTGAARPLPDKTGYYRLWSVFTSFFVVFFYKGTNNIVRGLSEEEKMCIHFSSSRGKRKLEWNVLNFKLKRKRVRTMNNKHKIVFSLTDTQYRQLLTRAEACSMRVNAFAKQKALDETDCIKLKKGSATTMAKLYAWSELTTDLASRNLMREAADSLWQSLK